MAEEAAVEESTEEVAEEQPPQETTEEEASQEASSEESRTDWRDIFTSEELRKEAEKSASPDDFGQRVLDMRKQLSTAIKPLRKNAKEEDIAAYRKAMGVPERIEDYVINPPEFMEPEDFESDEVKDTLKSFAERAHELNVPSETFTDLMGWYWEHAAKTEEAAAAQDKAFAEETKIRLEERWGPNKDKELAYANRGAEWLFGENINDFREMTNKGDRFIADDPLVIEAMNKIGRAVTEDGIGTFQVDAASQQSLRSELEQLTSDQMAAEARGEYEKSKAIDLKIMEVSRKISGDDPVVGAMGRAV